MPKLGLSMAFLAAVFSVAHAQTPLLIHYQGRLMNGTNLMTGSIGLELGLFDQASGGTLLYRDSNAVTVVDGLYQTDLGDQTVYGDLALALTHTAVWLQVTVNGVALSPRERLTSVPYARVVEGLSIGDDHRIALNAVGASNVAGAAYATVGGGQENVIGEYASHGVIAGGAQNRISNSVVYGSIGGGYQNQIMTGADSTTIGGGLLNEISENSSAATIGGGYQNRIGRLGSGATIAGGYQNTIESNSLHATIGGGIGNTIEAASQSAVVAGGQMNRISGSGSFIGAGVSNDLVGMESLIGAGYSNQVRGRRSAVIAGLANQIQTNSRSCFIGAGQLGFIGNSADGSAIVGGSAHRIERQSDRCFIGAGEFCVIGTSSTDTVIGGGYDNTTESGIQQGFIGAGKYNRLSGGTFCPAIAGGQANRVSGDWGAIPGGFANEAGALSFAAGNRAHATNSGCFVWGDQSSHYVGSTADNQFTVRATGGTRFISGVSGASITSGVQLAAGSGTWTSLSDRNAKENFEAVDSRDLLEKLLALPVVTWNYKTQDDGIRHIGPTAQDFRAAFGVGESDTGITTVDADGVALAAIQALNRKLEEENAALRARLEAIERRLNVAP